MAEGESLSRIAERLYGDRGLWKALAAYNTDRLPNPNVLKTGLVLRIPPKEVLLGGTAVAGAGFFAVNAVSAASLYYGFEYAWQTFGPPPEEKTNQTIAQKTVLFRVLNSSRNFALGYGFGGSVTVAAGFVAANFVTDTVIFVTNEYAWDVFRPGAPARSQLTPSSLAVIRGRP